MPLAAGTPVGPYEIESLLGAGGMGEVYRARDTRLGRTVAIKAIGPHRELTDEHRRRLLHEARTLSALQHPNIVTLYDLAEHGGRNYLVMEHVAGRTLDQVIERRGLPIAQVLKYAAAIADAIACAHANGILHRDLKPSNVIVADDGMVKVLDFGLAKPVSRAGRDVDVTATADAPITQEGIVTGTPAYMSPEQVEGGTLDARSDVFSFGAVLYEMVTGVRAFQGTSTASVMASILREEPRAAVQLVADLPPELDKVIQRCLRKDPAKRVQSMADVRALLDDLREQSGSSARVPSIGPARLSRRRAWLNSASLSAMAVLALIVAWISSRPGDAPAAAPTAAVPAPLKAVPLTSFLGEEHQPTLSPDGSQVAYVANIEDEDNWDIYVQVADAGATPVRLTSDPARERWPAWSPDGRWIAFVRSFDGGRRQVIRTAPVCGTEVVVLEEDCPWLAWSADSRRFVCGGTEGRLGLWTIGRDGGAPDVLTRPPAGCRDLFPAVSPDGSRLLFVRMGESLAKHLLLLDLDGDGRPVGEPRLLRAFPHYAGYLTWTANGREVLLAAGDEDDSLRLARLSIDAPHRDPTLLDLPEGRLYRAVVARGAPRLVYEHSTGESDLWQVKDGLAGAERHPLSSTRNEDDPQFAPDGSRIAFVSDRSGRTDVWAARADGTQPTQLTSLGAVSNPRWFPDGRSLVFERREPNGNFAVYRVGAAGGESRRLTDASANDSDPTVSRDGRWIYFTSSRTGRLEVHRMAAGGGQVTQVTPGGGEFAVETADGASIVFARTPVGQIARLAYRDSWRMPAGGGPEEPLPVATFRGTYTTGPTGVYFVPRDTSIPVSLYDFATHAVRPLRGVPTSVGEFTVSPDGRTVVFTKHTARADLMMVEGFR